VAAKLWGRPPSFELIQALHLVASGVPVFRACAVAGVAGTQVWRVLKSYGGSADEGSQSRARQALAHYGQSVQPLPRNECDARVVHDTGVRDGPAGERLG
jgi:hypothetical protein